VSTVADAPEVRVAHGPSAFGGGAQRFWHLTWLLAVTEFRLAYFGSALGYLWSLARPLMFFGVLYVVFHHVLRIGVGVPHYADLLLLNIVLFTFFSEATGNAVRAVVNREQLVRKMQFPRMVIPLSTVMTSVLNLATNLVAVLVFMVIDGVPVRSTWALMPIVLVLLIVFTTGVSMIVSSLYVRFRDVQPIWMVASQLLFYASPIIYPIEKAPPGLRRLLLCNPIADLLQQSRRWVIQPDAPGAFHAIGGFPWWLIPTAIYIGVCVFGVWIFNREAPKIAELL
jgi:ABC-2 type transport system permease protein